MNLIESLEHSARRWPQKTAFVEDANEVSYAALVEKISALAEKISALRLSPGSRIGLCFGNGVNYVALTYAFWKNRIVVVPVPTECPPEEMNEIAVAMELSGFVSPKPIGAGEALVPEVFVTRLNPAKPADNHGLNIAFIRFTSGTTNARKGVVLTHETIRDRVLAANKAFQLSEKDTVIWCLPMAHHFLITIVLYIEVGATVVLARHVTARPFIEATNKWRGTVLYAAPFHFSLLARDNSGAQLDSVRLAVSTTCALPQDVATQFHKRFGRPLLPALGIIELGLVALNREDALNRWNSVGRPAPDFQVKILSPDEHGVGEVAVKGPGICDAYAAPFQPRAQILRDGWFITGDLGRFDADGFLFLLSRKTAVINLAGRKVFPEEIEAVLDKHPAIKESRVFGRVHPHLGEVVEAEIVLKAPDSSIENLSHYCREHLASYKIPTRFHPVATLPRTAVTGKLIRTAATI